MDRLRTTAWSARRSAPPDKLGVGREKMIEIRGQSGPKNKKQGHGFISRSNVFYFRDLCTKRFVLQDGTLGLLHVMTDGHTTSQSQSAGTLTP